MAVIVYVLWLPTVTLAVMAGELCPFIRLGPMVRQLRKRLSVNTLEKAEDVEEYVEEESEESEESLVSDEEESEESGVVTKKKREGQGKGKDLEPQYASNRLLAIELEGREIVQSNDGTVGRILSFPHPSRVSTRVLVRTEPSVELFELQQLKVDGDYTAWLVDQSVQEGLLTRDSGM